MHPDQIRAAIRAQLAERTPHENTIRQIRAAIPVGQNPTTEQAQQLNEARAAIVGIDATIDDQTEALNEALTAHRREELASGMRRELAGGAPEAYDQRDGVVQPVMRNQSFAEHPLVARQIAQQRASRTGGDDSPGEQMHMGRYLRGLATGNWEGAQLEQRAMSEGVLAGGGYTVPVDLAASVIDRARNVGAVFPSGATIVPMDTQRLNVARLIGDPTASFRLENALIPASDASFDQVTLKARTLAALTVVSRELLEDSLNVDTVLRDAFAQQFALTIDAAALYGSGVDPNPLGVRNTSGITTISMGANGAVPASWDQVIDAVFSLEDNNEHANGIIYSPRTARTLAKLKDSTAQPLGLPPSIADLPRRTSNQVSNTQTQGTSTVSSDIFAGDWTKLLIGLRTSLEVRVLTERYAEMGQVAFLAWWRGDVVVARPKAFAIVQGVTAS